MARYVSHNGKTKLTTYIGNDDLDPVGRFISERSRMAPPTKEECDKLFEEMSKGSDEARKEHRKTYSSCCLNCSKFRQTNVQMEDIMAEGIQGLVVALDKFDHTRGIKLSTYAAWWIRQRIQRLIGKCLALLLFLMMYPKVNAKRV